MRVLVVIEKEDTYRVLVRLTTQKLIEEVLGLVNKKRHAQAMISVLTKGSFERQIERRDLETLRTDMILSESAVRWDLTG